MPVSNLQRQSAWKKLHSISIRVKKIQWQKTGEAWQSTICLQNGSAFRLLYFFCAYSGFVLSLFWVYFELFLAYFKLILKTKKGFNGRKLVKHGKALHICFKVMFLYKSLSASFFLFKHYGCILNFAWKLAVCHFNLLRPECNCFNVAIRKYSVCWVWTTNYLKRLA